jgi:phage-related minor tail protein
MADIAALGLSIDSTAAIKATADLDAFVGGANRAADANAKLAASSTQAAAAQTSASDAAAAASTASATAADRLLATVEKQIALFGASADAVAHYNGVLAGMAETELEWYKAQTLTLQSMQAQAAEANALAAAQAANVAAGERFIASLVTQSETIGLSKTELLEYKAAQLGVTEQAAPLIAAIETQTAALAASTTATTAAAESADAATLRFQAIAATALEWTAAQSETAAIAAKYAESVDAVAAAATEAERAGQSFNATLAATTAAATESAAAVTRAAEADDVYNAAVARTTASLERKAFAITATGAQLAEYDARLAGATEGEVAYQVMLAKEIELRTAQIAQGTRMAAAYVEEGAAAVGASFATSGVTREIVTMGNEINRGDVDRLAGSFVRLLNISGALDAVFSPVGIAVLGVVAALGVMTLAVGKGEAQWKAFNESLILTGDSAGTSAAGLQQMVNQISAGGERAGVAAKAITDLANSGRFTSDQIMMIGTAATQMADATGIAVDKTIAQFVKLQEDPVKASAALNEQYHYLTTAVFEQIDALQKQGDAVGAADAAEAAYASALGDRAKEIEGNLGTLQTAWKDIGDVASGAWNAMLGIGKPQTIQDQLDQVSKSLAAARAGTSNFDQALGTTETTQAPGGNVASLQSEQYRLQNEQGASRRAHDLQGSYQQTQQAGIAGQRVLDQLQNEYSKRSELTDVLDKQAAALRAVQEAGGQAADGQGADLTTAITKRLTPRTPSTRGAGALDNADSQQLLQGQKDQFTQQQKLESDNQQILDNNRKAKLVSDKDYYDQERQLSDQDLVNKLSYYARLEAMLRADIASSSTSAAQKVKDQTVINSLQSDANVAISHYAATQTEIDAKELQGTEAKTAAVQRYVATLQDQLNKQAEADNAQIAGGKHAGFAAQAQGKENIAATSLQQQLYSGKIDSNQYAAMDQAQQSAEATSVAMHEAATQKMQQADDSWSTGAEKAWSSWSSQAQNTTGQVAAATTGFLNGLTDDLLKFAMTGQVNFQALAASFVQALAKMEIQAAESKVFGLIQSGMAPGGSVSAGPLGALLQMFGMGGTSMSAGLGMGLTAGGSAGLDAMVTSAGTGIADSAGLGLGSQFAALATGFADGGHVTGPGSSTSDSIPARLSNGEFVVNAAATAQHRPILEALNGGARSYAGKTHFADGGFVNTGGGQGAAGTSIAFHINSTASNGQQDTSAQAQTRSAAMQKELQASVIEIVRKHSLPGGQINNIIRTAATR